MTATLPRPSFLLLIAVAAASLCGDATSEERIAKFNDKAPSFTVGNSQGYHVTPRSFDGQVSYTIDEKSKLDAIANRTFLVYTTSEVDKKVSDTQASLEADLDCTKCDFLKELAGTKSDLIKAISAAVGKELKPEQVEQIKNAIAVDVKQQVTSELDKLKANVKAELEAELRNHLKDEIIRELRR